MSLHLQPITFSEARIFVNAHHRHHASPQGHKFSIGLNDGERVVGVAICGRPVARAFDDGLTIEVTRLCTDGTKNASSMLYGACVRASKALGYKRIITYTLAQESGISLRAAGWKSLGLCGGGTWDRKNRPRVDKHPTGQKQLWESFDTRP